MGIPHGATSRPFVRPSRFETHRQKSVFRTLNKRDAYLSRRQPASESNRGKLLGQTLNSTPTLAACELRASMYQCQRHANTVVVACAIALSGQRGGKNKS